LSVDLAKRRNKRVVKKSNSVDQETPLEPTGMPWDFVINSFIRAGLVSATAHMPARIPSQIFFVVEEGKINSFT